MTRRLRLKAAAETAQRSRFEKGSALLLVGPHARKADPRFYPLKVIDAIVYPHRDAREAVIVRWDDLLDEYADTAYGQGRPYICRTCPRSAARAASQLQRAARIS